jgi:hypothetical protein
MHMKQKTTIKLAGLFCALVIWAPYLHAGDPGKPDTVITDSVNCKPGQNVMIGLKIFADDSVLYNNKYWVGVGSLCIPLKYDTKAFKLDSIKFVGTLGKWDEKFTNPRVDTGFVSIGGIYDIASSSKPVIYSPDSAQTMAEMFVTINRNAKPGNYAFEMTDDPVQKEAYLGSPDGMDGWKPVFISGKIVIEK